MMRLPRLLSVLLAVLVFWVRGTLSFSNGSVTPSCETMCPLHSTIGPQTSSPPYRVSASNDSYCPGARLTVTLEAVGNSSEFRGFMLQAREVGGRAAVGCFTSINTNLSRALDCFSIQSSTLSHASAVRKTQLQAMWLAPTNGSLGDIQFSATFVRNFNTYWLRVNSTTIKVVNVVIPSSSPSCHRLDIIVHTILCLIVTSTFTFH